MTEQELDALVKPLVWTEESPNCWFGRGSFGYQRDFRVFDGVAKVRIGTIGARVTPDHARGFYDREYVEFVLEALDTAAITTLRAQLAAETARADRAEATQSLPDGWEAVMCSSIKRFEVAAAINGQAVWNAVGSKAMAQLLTKLSRYADNDYHRTALDAAIRAAKVEAWRLAASVAANACLVEPDGGSPTEEERLVCDEACCQILALIGEACP